MTSNQHDFVVIVMGKIALIALSILTIKLSTKLLPPDVMGQLYIFTTIYTFFVLFLISPVGQYVNRYTHKWQSEKVLHNRLLRHFLYMLVVSCFAALVSVLLYRLGWTAGLSVFNLSLLVGLFVFVLSANQTVVPLLNMLNYRIVFTVFSFLTNALALLLSFAFIINIHTSLIYWLLGILLANVIVLLLAWLFLYKKELASQDVLSSYSLNKNGILSAIKFSAPVAIAMAFMWAQNTGYRMSIESLRNAHYLGLLGVGLMLATQLSSVVETILMQYLHPIFYKRIQSDKYDERLAAVNFYIGISIPVYLSLALFLTYSIDYIFPILIDEQYSDGVVYCLFGVWIEFFRMVTNSISNIAHAETKMKSYMFPYMFGATATNILVYYAAISDSEIDLVPLALLSGSAFTMLCMMFYMKKIMQFSIDFKFILLSAGLVLPSVLCINTVSFPAVVNVEYIFFLFLSCILFLGGWIALFFIGKKLWLM